MAIRARLSLPLDNIDFDANAYLYVTMHEFANKHNVGRLFGSFDCPIEKLPERKAGSGLAVPPSSTATFSSTGDVHITFAIWMWRRTNW